MKDWVVDCRPEICTEKSSKVGAFSVAQEHTSKTPVSPPNHHKLTTKTPRQNHLFFKTPLKKHPKNIKNSAPPPPKFFPAKIQV